jgi:hypothetical protein
MLEADEPDKLSVIGVESFDTDHLFDLRELCPELKQVDFE